jgi:hypothetical protein
MTTSDQVRDHVFKKYVLTVRKHGWKQVAVVAGEVAKDMHLSNRLPLVCGAIGALKFQREHQISLLSRTGPGQGAHATFTFSI